MAYGLPPPLVARLNALPLGLRAHVERVRDIARELAQAHGVDEALADLTAAAHDVARHLPGARLIEETERLGMPISVVERAAPILLHGPVGAAWLEADGSVEDRDALDGVRWHTTGSPDLSPVGEAVLLADKLDPHKARAYPFQASVREAAFRDLHEGVLAFLDGAIRAHIDRGELAHPLSIETRNRLILARSC